MGPFTVLASDTNYHWEVRAGDGELVADYVPASDIANLLAAAPELLAALKDCVEWLESVPLGDAPQRSVQNARSVIAKAEGRSE